MRLSRILLSMVLSLFLGVAICIALFSMGLLNFQIHNEKFVIRPFKREVIQRIAPSGDSLNKTTNIYSKEDDPERNLEAPTKSKVKSGEPDGNILGSSVSPADSERNHVYASALVFLSTVEEQGKDDIEERFTNFLTDELHVKPEDVQRMVRMSFWKNFVTLQEQWQQKDWSPLETEFKKEMELKKAGFKAMGLTLMESVFQEAETDFQNLRQKLGDKI